MREAANPRSIVRKLLGEAPEYTYAQAQDADNSKESVEFPEIHDAAVAIANGLYYGTPTYGQVTVGIKTKTVTLVSRIMNSRVSSARVSFPLTDDVIAAVKKFSTAKSSHNTAAQAFNAAVKALEKVINAGPFTAAFETALAELKKKSEDLVAGVADLKPAVVEPLKIHIPWGTNLGSEAHARFLHQFHYVKSSTNSAGAVAAVASKLAPGEQIVELLYVGDGRRAPAAHVIAGPGGIAKLQSWARGLFVSKARKHLE